MASPIRGIQSVDQQMLEHLKYRGIAQENLVDLVGLFVSLKNKYGLIPFAMTAESKLGARDHEYIAKSVGSTRSV